MLHHYTCYNCCKPVGVFLFVKTEITTSEPPDTTRHIPTINVAVDIASKGLNSKTIDITSNNTGVAF